MPCGPLTLRCVEPPLDYYLVFWILVGPSRVVVKPQDINAHLATSYDSTLIHDILTQGKKILNDKSAILSQKSLTPLDATEDEKRTVAGCILALSVNGNLEPIF